MKKTIRLLITIVFLMFLKAQAQLPQPLPSLPRLADSIALVQFYNVTGGPNWTNNTNWKSSAPISSWYGVSVLGNRVSSINLPNNNLTGFISIAIVALNALREFDISGNSVEDNNNNLAAFLTGKNQLAILNLSNNNFSGRVPLTLNRLPNLVYLNLSNNDFSETLPSLEASNNIRAIYLSGNDFFGSIPTSYANFQSLLYLYLDSNRLSNGIQRITNSKSLQQLNLSANQFTGPIPTALGNIITLQQLWLNNNNFTGTIPSELGSLSLLQILGLNHNQLNGTIPSSFSGLGFLQRLNLRDNDIEGPLPAFLTTLSLNHLGLISNKFTFAGLESLVSQIATLEYQKQQPVVLAYNPNSGKLSVAAGGTSSNNTYTWYLNGSQVGRKTGDSTYLPTTSGAYYVEVTNSVATDLTLRSKNKNVTVSSPVVSASIYPNPARNITILSFNLEGNSLVKVSDRNGRMMATKTVSNVKGASQLKLDVASYPTGVYYITIDNGIQIQRLQLNKQ